MKVEGSYPCRIYIYIEREGGAIGEKDIHRPLRCILTCNLSSKMSAITPVQILKTLSSPSSSSGAFYRVHCSRVAGRVQLKSRRIWRDADTKPLLLLRYF
jgi:hypothetical protein